MERLPISEGRELDQPVKMFPYGPRIVKMEKYGFVLSTKQQIVAQLDSSDLQKLAITEENIESSKKSPSKDLTQKIEHSIDYCSRLEDSTNMTGKQQKGKYSEVVYLPPGFRMRKHSKILFAKPYSLNEVESQLNGGEDTTIDNVSSLSICPKQLKEPHSSLEENLLGKRKLRSIDSLLSTPRSRVTLTEIIEAFRLSPEETKYISGVFPLPLDYGTSIQDRIENKIMEYYLQVLLTDGAADPGRIQHFGEWDANNLGAILQKRNNTIASFSISYYFRKLHTLLKSEKYKLKELTDRQVLPELLTYVLMEIGNRLGLSWKSFEDLSLQVFRFFHEDQALKLLSDDDAQKLARIRDPNSRSKYLYEGFVEFLAEREKIKVSAKGLYVPDTNKKMYFAELFKSENYLEHFKQALSLKPLLEMHQRKLQELVISLRPFRETMEGMDAKPVPPELELIRDKMASVPAFSMLIYAQRLLTDMVSSIQSSEAPTSIA